MKTLIEINDRIEGYHAKASKSVDAMAESMTGPNPINVLANMYHLEEALALRHVCMQAVDLMCGIQTAEDFSVMVLEKILATAGHSDGCNLAQCRAWKRIYKFATA